MLLLLFSQPGVVTTPVSGLALRTIAAYRRALNYDGETIKIRRYSGTGAARTYVETPVIARVVGYTPQELVGNVRQGDRKIIALGDDLTAILPLHQSDSVIIRGAETAIQAIDDSTRRVAGTLVALEIQVRG